MPSRRTRAGSTRQGSGVNALADGVPDDFARAAHLWLGDEAETFLQACARPPHLALRANSAKGGAAALLRALRRGEEWPRVPWWPDALLSPPVDAAREAAGVLARVGALYAQDPAALAAVAVLDPQPGERVLDLCAAPGGKSTAIADRMLNRGLLVANDVDARRARELARTLERWGVQKAAALTLTPERLAALAPCFFDRVLVDAPCSGEAMFARHDRAAADWSPAHVAGCAARQRRLLDVARGLAWPGGVLVYATCTFNPSENEEVIAAYLDAHPDDRLDDARTLLPMLAPGRPDLLTGAGPRAAELSRCGRLWPHRAPGAGHFVARIRVSSEPIRTDRAEQRRRDRHATAPKTTPDAELVAVRAAVEAAAPAMLSSDAALTIDGDHAYLVPGGLPPALREAALVPGLRVAERRGRTWRPAHALAMALRLDDARHVVPLDRAAADTLLTGRPVEIGHATADGLALATLDGYPLGWARARGGTLTPLIPKGLLAPSHAALSADPSRA